MPVQPSGATDAPASGPSLLSVAQASGAEFLDVITKNMACLNRNDPPEVAEVRKELAARDERIRGLEEEVRQRTEARPPNRRMSRAEPESWS